MPNSNPKDDKEALPHANVDNDTKDERTGPLYPSTDACAT